MSKLKENFKIWLSRKSEECKNIAPLFSYSHDRQLSLLEKLRVKIHLYTCSACANYISNLKFMDEIFHAQEKQIETEKLHITLSQEAKERIKQKLKTQSN